MLPIYERPLENKAVFKQRKDAGRPKLKAMSESMKEVSCV